MAQVHLVAGLCRALARKAFRGAIPSMDRTRALAERIGLRACAEALPQKGVPARAAVATVRACGPVVARTTWPARATALTVRPRDSRVATVALRPVMGLAVAATLPDMAMTAMAAQRRQVTAMAATVRQRPVSVTATAAAEWSRGIAMGAAALSRAMLPTEVRAASFADLAMAVTAPRQVIPMTATAA